MARLRKKDCFNQRHSEWVQSVALFQKPRQHVQAVQARRSSFGPERSLKLTVCRNSAKQPSWFNPMPPVDLFTQAIIAIDGSKFKAVNRTLPAQVRSRTRPILGMVPRIRGRIACARRRRHCAVRHSHSGLDVVLRMAAVVCGRSASARPIFGSAFMAPVVMAIGTLLSTARC